MKRLWILAATISGTLVMASALPAPSVEAGAAKAATCQACHGANGNSSNAEWPSLAGIGADYIAEQLNNFKTGKRAYPGGDQAHGVPACMACHGPTGKGNEPAKFPALRGQQPGYVVKQLNDYAAGTRATGPNSIMQTIAKRLSADDIRNLASYVEGIR